MEVLSSEAYAVEFHGYGFCYNLVSQCLKLDYAYVLHRLLIVCAEETQLSLYLSLAFTIICLLTDNQLIVMECFIYDYD